MKTIQMERTINECPNRKCRFRFSVIGYSHEDKRCTKIDAAKLIPLTGRVKYFCPCCGVNISGYE